MFVYIKIVEYLNNVIVTRSYIPLLRLHVRSLVVQDITISSNAWCKSFIERL